MSYENQIKIATSVEGYKYLKSLISKDNFDFFDYNKFKNENILVPKDYKYYTRYNDSQTIVLNLTLHSWFSNNDKKTKEIKNALEQTRENYPLIFACLGDKPILPYEGADYEYIRNDEADELCVDFEVQTKLCEYTHA